MMRAARNRYCSALLCCFGVTLIARAGNVKRIEQDDPSVKYAGQWFPNFASGNSGGSATLSNSDCSTGGFAPGSCPYATATLTFTGSGITWVGIKDACNGLALVTLDGVQNTVDTYGPTTLYQQPIFTARGLDGGKHTLTIQPLHVRDGNTVCGSYVFIDAFDVDNGNSTKDPNLAGPGLVQQSDSTITYSGTWFLVNNSAMSGGSAVEATDFASSVTIGFFGSGIQWIGYQDQYSGIANVYIDGAKVATIDTYSAVAKAQSVIYSATNLENGAHTITIEATGTHDANSTESSVWVDAFNITGK
jgi:hypothetical protein